MALIARALVACGAVLAVIGLGLAAGVDSAPLVFLAAGAGVLGLGLFGIDVDGT